MRLIKRFILFFLLLASAHLQAQKIAVADLRADLDFLQTVLYKGHQGVFLYNKKDSLDLFFNALRVHLKGDSVSMAQAQVTVRLAVARVRDGHTSVQTPFYSEKTQILPFTISVVGEKAYIIGNYSGDTTLKRGTEIRTINGEPVSTVIRLGHLIQSSDGFNQTFAESVASVYFARHQSLFFGVHKMNVINVLSDKGVSYERKVGSMSRLDLLKLLNVKVKRPPEEKPILKFKDMVLRRDTVDKNTALLQLGSFPNGRYKRFYRRAFRWLDEQHIQNLVVDVRYNTGGNVDNMGYLLAKILDEPFSYRYERQRHTHIGRYFNFKGKAVLVAIWMRYNLHPRFKHGRESNLNLRYWLLKPRTKHNFNGKVYVLTNGWSFSSASMCASFLKNRNQATVIGIETGGNETGNCGGGYPQLKLPHTKFKVRFPVYHLRYAVGKTDKGRGVMPDYPVHYKIGDILEGKDLEMDQLHSLLKNRS
ncbi:MAG: S41 family peptidase [Bacteroidota bacterium]